MSADPRSNSPGLVTTEQIVKAFNAPQRPMPNGPATPLEAAGVVADLADQLDERIRPMLSGPHATAE